MLKHRGLELLSCQQIWAGGIFETSYCNPLMTFEVQLILEQICVPLHYLIYDLMSKQEASMQH